MAVLTSMLPSAPIAAFAESLVEGRRVLLLGSSAHSLWQKLLDRGARMVHVCDPDPIRLAESSALSTQPNASFAPLSNQAALALRDSVFDLGIVDNLASFSDPAEILRILRKALAPRAVALVTTPNPDVREALLPDPAPSRHQFDYYSLYDLVRTAFPVVRMLGQMPFVGYTVAELAPLDEPEPTIDAGFVSGGTEEPEWFIAAASAQPFGVESFTVVQVPVTEVLHHSSERQLREQLRVSRNAERSAVERLARLEAQQLDLSARAAEAKEQYETSQQVVRLRGEAQGLADRIMALEARSVAAEARAGDAERQVEQMRQALSRAERAEAEQARLVEHLEAARLQAKSAEQLASDSAADIVRFETQLRERGVAIRRLEADLKAAERTGHQLLRDLQAARAGHHRQFGSEAWAVSNARLGSETLAADTAQRSGTSSAWVPSQVEGSAGETEADVLRIAEDRARLQADLIAAEWRIDQLMSSLEKEHQDREKLAAAMSELADAQCRLNEQAALLSQLESQGIRS